MMTHPLDEQDRSAEDTRNTEKNGGIVGYGCVLSVCACPKPGSRTTEVRK